MSRVNRQPEGAPFALLGAIDRVGDATMPIITPGERTAVFRVESVLWAPAALPDLTGAEVTVELRTLTKAGERMLLLADGWMYGESVAVREAGRRDPGRVDNLRDRHVREQEEAPVLHLSERVRGADAIVVGAVRELRPIKRPDEWVPTSEHDADWWVATIAVEGVVKGRKPRGGRLEAIFANSRDVQWATAPKPDPGQQGVFLLRRETRWGAPKGALALLDPADVQPREHLDDIRRLSEGVG
jgi:hypothetical protein